MSDNDEDDNEGLFGYSGDELQDFAKYLNRLNKKDTKKNNVKVQSNTNIFSFNGEVLDNATEETVAKCLNCHTIVNINISGNKCWRCGSQKLDTSVAKNLLEEKSKKTNKSDVKTTNAESINCSKCKTKITLSISGNKCWKCGNIENNKNY